MVEAWLVEGRSEMIKRVKESGLKGEAGVREGLRERLRYNEPVLDKLVEVSSLCIVKCATEADELLA